MEIDSKSKSILSFRPKIDFIEPEQGDSPIEAISDVPSPSEINEKRTRIKNLADSVNKLATAVQSKIDSKSKDQIIILDGRVDNAIIKALRRSYPNAANFDRITYEQYKTCKDRLRNNAARVALRSVINQNDVDEARGNIKQGRFTVGGIGTEEATNGGLRPDLDDRNRLIDPLDIDKFQFMVSNMFWDTYIYPILKPLPFIGSAIKKRMGKSKGEKDFRSLVDNTKSQISDQSAASDQTRKSIEGGDIPQSINPDAEKISLNVTFPEIDNPIQFQDCQYITKTYEKGCHVSMTEASVFAPMTDQLNFIRNMSGTIAEQMSSYTPAPKIEPQGRSEDFKEFFDKLIPDSLDIGFGADVQIGLPTEGKFFEWLNDCIPCALRINIKEELTIKVGITNIGVYMLEIMEAWLLKALSQIRNLIDMFKNLDKYVDICALINFFKDFVCIPDLAKILAVLAALMMDLSFELNAIVDFALSLIVPFFMPFLTNLLDSLMKYVLLIIRPIECIIDSIQNMLGKLDYNVLFRNIPRPSQILKPDAVKIPILGALVPEGGISLDLGAPQRAIREKEQAAVDKAYDNLLRLKKASSNVDASDPEAYERYKKQEAQARQEYNDARRERDLSEIGETNLALEQFQTTMKSTILELMSMLREAVLKVDAWVQGLFEEFKKMLNQYVGGNGLYINLGVKKLAIIQMIAFIKAIIDFINNPNKCEENQEVEVFVNSLSKESGFKVITDENGDIFIEEDIDGLDDVANALNIQDPNALIHYTGDKVLDATLKDTVGKLTIPNRLRIKCGLQSSIVDQEQVNKWISEINSEPT